MVGLALLLVAAVVGLVPAAIASASTPTATVYTYDSLASVAHSARADHAAAGPAARLVVRGSGVPPRGRLGLTGGFADAAESGTARFAVNSAGEATMSLKAGSTSLEVSEHAALRMTQRGISIDAAEATLAHESFPYFHQGVWKTGYYDPASRIFLGSVNGEVTTVIRGASPNYINNLKAATP